MSVSPTFLLPKGRAVAVLSGCLLACSLLLMACSPSEPEPVAPGENAQYMPIRSVASPLPRYAEDNNNIKHEVVELFMYTCTHCNKLKQRVYDWSTDEVRGDTVNVEYVPIVFSVKNMRYIKLHYALLDLGVDEHDVITAIFKAVHDEKRSLVEKKDFFQLGAEIAGVSADEVEAVMATNDVNTRSVLAMKLFNDSKATGVPTFIVDGDKRLDLNDAHSYEHVFTSLDYMTQE